MGDISIRNTNQIYKDGKELVPDLFDMAIEYYGYITAFNSKKLLIFNPYGEIIVSEEGSVYQINEAGKCLSFQRKATEKMGVYSFKGNILIPFDYDLIFIKFNEKPRFEVKKNYYDGGWEVYNVDN